MVFPTSRLHELGYFQGFSPNLREYLHPILRESFFAPRHAAEFDESLKQLIPYAILRHNGLVFRYRRTRYSDESRLRTRYSIGIGGHINLKDASSPAQSDLSQATPEPTEVAVMREIREEVAVDCSSTECIGVINDDSVSVGRVHLGLVFLCSLDKPGVVVRERSYIEDGALVHPSSIISHLSEYESWSRILMESRAAWL